MYSEPHSAPTRLFSALLFVGGLLLVLGITQFATPAFSEDSPSYSVTLRDGFER